MKTENNKRGIRRYLPMALIASFTLGLAPFIPHAHIWKQLKNLWFHRTMTGMDWFDLLLHGTPWIAFIYILVQMARGK